MSHNQPPPGPYGQQPPQPPPQPPQSGQPGPYGAPAPPPPGGPNPYAQGGGGVPGQPGYGYPQQPGQPYGQPGMPGAPTPPPSGGGKGKTIGIIVAALALVVAVVGGAVFYMSGDDDKDDKADSSSSEGQSGGSSGGDDGGDTKVAPYKVVPPKTVLGGEYTMAGSPKKEEDLSNDPKASKLGVENGKGANAEYATSKQERLQLLGIYGEVSDPEAATDAMFDQVHENQSNDRATIDNYQVETTDGPEEYTPDGFDGTILKCETRKQTGEISAKPVELEFATCVWADNSAVGVVSQTGAVPTAGSGAYGNSMEQDALAEATAKIRESSRQEI
ncbi:hypothetical protein [Streptomyces oceani]|uniref:hypothetical protein n=1 Tax=Streptomyces oceani TaxID=1075402 RepID=UPI000A5AB805|nr:hypothetical protein [Streptomyces oceani]